MITINYNSDTVSEVWGGWSDGGSLKAKITQLSFRALCKIAADDSLFFLLLFIRKKIRTIHMKCQVLFSLKNAPKKIKMLQLCLVL